MAMDQRIEGTECIQSLNVAGSLSFNYKSSANGDILIRDIVFTESAPLHFVEFIHSQSQEYICWSGKILWKPGLVKTLLLCFLRSVQMRTKQLGSFTLPCPSLRGTQSRSGWCFSRSFPSNDSFYELSETFLNEQYGAAEAGLSSGVSTELNKESNNGNASSVQFPPPIPPLPRRQIVVLRRCCRRRTEDGY